MRLHGSCTSWLLGSLHGTVNIIYQITVIIQASEITNIATEIIFWLVVVQVMSLFGYSHISMHSLLKEGCNITPLRVFYLPGWHSAHQGSRIHPMRWKKTPHGDVNYTPRKCKLHPKGIYCTPNLAHIGYPNGYNTHPLCCIMCKFCHADHAIAIL